jgi:Na+/H+ antiporter family
LTDAVIPLVALVASIAAALSLFGPLDALEGPIQVGLIICCAIAALIAVKNGHKWSVVEEVGEGAMSSITSAIFILLAVGALIGAWNLSGTIPTLVYYGIQVLSPGYYYLAAILICGAVSMSIGSSWTVAGTIGVGLVGLAPMLGVSPVITAGAVISGSYLGDKLSPLSEMTVLSAQIANIGIYTHIRAQAWTTVPAFVLATVAFAVCGVVGPPVHDEVPEAVELAKLDQIFWISPVNLLPLVLLVIFSLRRAPAYLALLGSALFACVQATITQRDVVSGFVREIDGSSNPLAGSIQAIWTVMANGFSSDTGIADIDYLLSRGGDELHADDYLADHRVCDVRRPAGAVRPDRPAHQAVDRRRAQHRQAVRLGVRLRRQPQPVRRGSADRRGAARPDVSGRVRPPRIRPSGAVPAGSRQRYPDLGAGAMELLRCVHGRRPGCLDAGLPAVCRLQLRCPGAEHHLRHHRVQDRQDDTGTRRGGKDRGLTL